MPTERFEISDATHGMIAALLDRPDTPARAYAVWVHGLGDGLDSAAAGRIAGALSGHGIAVLRLEGPGLNGHPERMADAVVAAADHLRLTRAAPAIVIGHGLGGAAVIAAAARVAEVRAVVTIGAAAGSAALLASMPRLGKALLVMHSAVDAVVSVEHAATLYRAAKHPKSFVSLDRADHGLSDRRDAQYAADVIAAWVGRYLPAEAAELDALPPDALPNGVVEVRERGVGLFQQVVRHADHALIADEPVKVGGDGNGLDPYALLLAALGACTSMTMRMYARQKQWPLDGITVRLSHRKMHAQDCEPCETKTGKLDHIHREIKLIGAQLDATQRARLIEIANKCPVHKTLHSEIHETTVLVE